MPFEKGHQINNLKILGKKFGRLSVIKYLYTDNRHNTIWECECDCGNKTETAGSSMISGNTQSCGCLGAERRLASRKTHGMRDDPFYKRWCAMRSRCRNENTVGYKNWGGRGIKVCKRWEDFFKFKEDMYQGYLDHVKKFGRKNTCLDRINNNKNYQPSNCRWATRIEQNSNTRKNVFIEFNGLVLTMSEWARRIGVDRSTILYRVFEAKWPLEKALTKKR